MSMWLNVARVSSRALQKMAREDALVEALFFGEGAEAERARQELGMEADHTAGMDYLLAREQMETMSRAMGERVNGDPVIADLGVSGELEYEAGYGPAFFLDPEAVRNALTESTTLELDSEVASLFAEAAQDGQFVVAVVS
ncbi:MAG: hypothetical protein JJ863_34380 [Deltaproteobacteria bacterium]|nr:hypothetical protein [Deltaproteobacteria bacterium]